VVLLVVVGLLLCWGTLGNPLDDGGTDGPEPVLLRYVPFALALSGLLFLARRFTDNFYLLDPERQCLYYHFKFLGFRRIRLLLTRREVLGVTTEARKRSADGGASWWEHRLVVIGKGGRVVPLSDWRKEGLGRCNREGAERATLLACPFHPAPPRSDLVVRVKGGVASVRFARMWLGMRRLRPGEYWPAVLVVLLGALAVVAALKFIHF
jgi:hypothetical protein